MENPFDIFEQIYEAHDNGEISDEEMVFLCESAEEKLMLVQESYFGLGGAAESGVKSFISGMSKAICDYAGKTIKAGKKVELSEIGSIIKDAGKKIINIVGNLKLSRQWGWNGCSTYFNYSNDMATMSGFFNNTLPNVMKEYVDKSNGEGSYTERYGHIKAGVKKLEAAIKKMSDKVANHYAQFFKDHKDAKDGKGLGQQIIDATNKNIALYNKYKKPDKVNGKTSVKNAVSNAGLTLLMAKSIKNDVSNALLSGAPNETIHGIPNLEIPEDEMRRELRKPKKKLKGDTSEDKPEKRELAKPNPKSKDEAFKMLAGKIARHANSKVGKPWRKSDGYERPVSAHEDGSVRSPYYKGKYE